MKNILVLCIFALLLMSVPLAAAWAGGPHVRHYQQRMIPAPYSQTNPRAQPVEPPGTIPEGLPPVYQSISPTGTPQIRQPRY